MVNYRIKSLILFATLGVASSSIIVFTVFGFDVFIPYVLIGYSTLFSGMWAYILGHNFGKISEKSYYKAMLLGVGITLLAIVTTAFVSALTIAFLSHYPASTMKVSKSNSEAILFAGLIIIFATPTIAAIIDRIPIIQINIFIPRNTFSIWL